MLDYLCVMGTLLLVAPFVCMMTQDYDEFEDRCINAMLIQAVVAIVLLLVGFGVLIGGK